MSLKCSEPGCKSDAIECRLPDGAYQSWCTDHAPKYGFCSICGEFWGGIESFEFIHPGVCDECDSQIALEDEQMREDYCDEDDYEENWP